ncbi:hypothetical protein LPB67_10445 [Undibacterium sp. Jales W-56]|uniref:hypothetical protein n=1 Tax=Undibacterium sp. Jales W-56 TaxID=2897325 RepID=UPI0021CE4B09|nr:hypothetical protein [Undibacterium sp. Jales W-56]MCU6434188.1 hypothetical protein [Undibacterium sp. Jales W-56]
MKNIIFPKWKPIPVGSHCCANFISSIFLFVFILFLGVGLNARADDTAPDANALHNVWIYIEHNDCKGAVKVLNEGIANKHKDILLMAGTMYEEGICLKKNWAQASLLYQSALSAGNKSGLARLVSGYAVAGREPATSIWWAAQSDKYFFPECKPKADPITETDKFIAEMNTWSKETLEACAYTLGVAFTILGELDFPTDASFYGIAGDLLMTFMPSKGSVNWEKGEERDMGFKGVVSGNAVRNKKSSSVKDSLITNAYAISDRALKRYTQPLNINPAWQYQLTYKFIIK